ncbi:ATP-binding protein [Geoalkalibacter halelectricus]|uniref:histidine kinase n=1 Tax=Geoalkalibacter halelectricus TaxID=2847045 RepID=A0ABY5ZLZ4_9BACT|nr:ATP-binding protein [Geoalkalibacter halelectricus]MDO3378599.1 ATP-binding protein [Geoalkalibacter halelectricus]UWZ80088.1 ATP-binding protein [Geoalkalibacter halelectricus]
MAATPAEFLSALSLSEVLESLPFGLFLVDCDQHIVYWNPAAARITGFSPAEAVGRHCSFLKGIPCGRRCGLYDPTVPKPVTSVTCTIRNHAGQRVTLSKSVDLLRSPSGEVVGGVESFVDISAMKGLERRLRRHALEREREVRARTRELQQEHIRLQAANRELDAFVHTVSHDLRTPLTPIIGYAEFLRENYRRCLDSQALEILADIETQGNRMLALMEDLLTLARVGRLEPPAEPVDGAAVVGELLGAMRTAIAEAGLEVRVAALPAIRLPRTLLSEIFANLIQNALRYAGQNGGPIEIGGRRRGTRCELFVRDHGPGVPKDIAEKIFDPFFRGHPKEGGPKGTGIGLTIVNKIVRLYGGRIWVADTPGGGATFHLEFPDV